MIRDDLLDGLTNAFDDLVRANPRDSTKGDSVKSWVAANFPGETATVSHVTEKKQLYNRVPEQFKHKTSLVFFVCNDENILEPLQRTVRSRAYPGLKAVYLFVREGGYFLRSVLLGQGESNLTPLLLDRYGDASVERLPIDDSAHGADVEQALVVSWAVDADLTDEPCGLIGMSTAFQNAITALQSDKNVIFIGPPGTGKTTLAQCICETLGVSYDLVTANADWSSFELIGGYFPSLKSEHESAASIAVDFQPGFATEAIRRKKWLIIDELNRADIDKAFGELFTLLSGQDVRLPYRKFDDGALKNVVLSRGERVGQDEFLIRVPQDWRIIGAMNTFDKASLFQLSFAFMRRFAFISVDVPGSTAYASILSRAVSDLMESCEVTPAVDAWSDCYAAIVRLFASDDSASLRNAGVPVGPAIALDVLRFAFATLAEIGDRAIADVLLNAFEMYLYPQFEGRDDKHIELVRAFTTILSLEGTAGEDLSRRLAIWTGYSDDSAFS